MCHCTFDYVQLGQSVEKVDGYEQGAARGVHEIYGRWQVVTPCFQERVEMARGEALLSKEVADRGQELVKPGSDRDHPRTVYAGHLPLPKVHD